MRSSILLTGLLLSVSVFANTEQAIIQCSTVSDKLERLICYDNISQALKNNQPAVLMSAPAQLHKKNDAEANFGLRKKANEDALEKIYAQVTKVTKNTYGALTITFNNGQVWKQTDSRYFKVKDQDTLFIKKAALGSFIIGRDNQNTTIKVKRLY